MSIDFLPKSIADIVNQNDAKLEVVKEPSTVEGSDLLLAEVALRKADVTVSVQLSCYTKARKDFLIDSITCGASHFLEDNYTDDELVDVIDGLLNKRTITRKTWFGLGKPRLYVLSRDGEKKY